MSKKWRESLNGISPLKYSLFRALWIATVFSSIGTYMQLVGEAWLMTTLVQSSFLVALIQGAQSLPIVLLALPAGALADIIDRRKLLLFTNFWMLSLAAILGVLTIIGATTPLILLVLIFLVGLGTAMGAPATAAFLLETVPRSEAQGAINLGGVAASMGTVVGPALGGIIVAIAGPAAVFLLNSISFVGVMLVLRRWRSSTTSQSSMLPAEHMIAAIRAGIRYVRNVRDLHTIFIRVSAFSACSSALLALLPSLARRELGLDSFEYGLLLTLFGVGAIIGGIIVMPKLRMISVEYLIITATILFAIALATLALTNNLILLGMAVILAGIAQLMIMSSMNFAMYRTLPKWVLARTLAFYQLVFMAGTLVGSVLWGILADQTDIRIVLLIAAFILIAGLLAKLRYPLKAGKEDIDVSPSMRWSTPQLVIEPYPDQGPVLIKIEYEIDPKYSQEFVRAIQDLSIIRKRDGALFWGLFRHDIDPNVYVEAFFVDSWMEHLRQHERITIADRTIEDRARAFHIGDVPPSVSHFVAEPLHKIGKKG